MNNTRETVLKLLIRQSSIKKNNNRLNLFRILTSNFYTSGNQMVAPHCIDICIQKMMSFQVTNQDQLSGQLPVREPIFMAPKHRMKEALKIKEMFSYLK